MIDLSVGILTHPDRADRLQMLLLKLGGDDVNVYLDTGIGYWR